MLPARDGKTDLSAGAARIVPLPVRELFFKYCREISQFSDDIAVEVAPFEVRFSAPAGFMVRVSPYRDIFLVSIGSACPCEVRVSAVEGYYSALDLALHHYLETGGKHMVEPERV